ncbi:hypothetical protein BHM03_00002453 [Ensete ventricosum]|nr:hypothetical protein BHM03_00002453 [Ensete ventricosum]
MKRFATKKGNPLSPDARGTEAPPRDKVAASAPTDRTKKKKRGRKRKRKRAHPNRPSLRNQGEDEEAPKLPFTFTFTLENGLTLIAPWEVAKSETTLHFHLGKWLHPYCTLGRDEIRRDPSPSPSPSPSPLLPHGKWQNLK